MSLNIKNKDAHKLAQRLAKLTGESLTKAVTEAVRERLKRVQEKDKRTPNLSDRLLEIGRDCAPHLKEPFRSADHGDLLYDEKGLPK
jgi:antitoxin VapB